MRYVYLGMSVGGIFVVFIAQGKVLVWDQSCVCDICTVYYLFLFELLWLWSPNFKIATRRIRITSYVYTNDCKRKNGTWLLTLKTEAV